MGNSHSTNRRRSYFARKKYKANESRRIERNKIGKEKEKFWRWFWTAPLALICGIGEEIVG